MKHRVRAAVFMLRDDHVLLVEQGHPLTEDIWWTPPGGGREAQDQDIFACAQREVREECALDVELDRIIYLREFYDAPLDTLMMEIYFLASSFRGVPSAEIEREQGLPYPPITRVGWYTQEQIQSMIVYPEIMRDEFWQDAAKGFPGVRYLPQMV